MHRPAMLRPRLPLVTLTALGLVLGSTGACAPPPGEPGPDAAELLSRAERTGYRETTRYPEVVEIVAAAAAASPRIHATDFGYSFEGRPLPMAVWGDVDDASPQAVLGSGKTRVWIMGNIHGGEVCGKEALLVLLRDLSRGEHAAWADSLVLLIAPVYNADGNERIQVGHRRGQNGPVGGMGQRPNAQDYDLNRDHMKLDSPEARSLVKTMRDYDPHVAIDLHTTNGTHHAYHLTYSPPLHPNTPATIDDLLRDEWLPAVTEAIRDEHGWDYYHYGNAGGFGGRERAWRTFDHRPRFNNNYVGLRNRFAILSEAYAYASFEERILASLYFVEEILDWAAGEAGRIARIVEEADAAAVVGERLVVRAEPRRSAEPVTILMGEVERVLDPYSGRTILQRLDVSEPEEMYEYIAFQPSAEETVPAAYYLPPDPRLQAAVDKLTLHGVVIGRLDAETTLELEEFAIAASTTSERPFQGHHERTLEGSWRATERTLPAGTAVVEVDQALGRLAFSLLEPRSDDGLANWNVLDGALEGAELYPILRSH